MSKSLKEIVKDIQYKTDLTLDQIADQAGYSRGYFRNEVSKGTSKTIRDSLQAKFNEIIERNVPHETLQEDAPVDEYGPYGSKYIKLLEDSLREKGDQLKELKARLNELEGRQRDFLSKVEDSIERYEHLVLVQLQNGKKPEPEGNIPIVQQRVYRPKDKSKQ